MRLILSFINLLVVEDTDFKVSMTSSACYMTIYSLKYDHIIYVISNTGIGQLYCTNLNFNSYAKLLHIMPIY